MDQKSGLDHKIGPFVANQNAPNAPLSGKFLRGSWAGFAGLGMCRTANPGVIDFRARREKERE
jgi:hypothetical protein